MKILLFPIIFLLIPLAYALEECTPTTEPTEIPCLITSLWNYTQPCSQHTARVYNSSGGSVINYTYSNMTDSGRCYITWNITSAGSYVGDVTNGDTFNITVGLDNMQLSIIIGIGVTIAAMLFIAFKLDRQHFILQLGLVFFSVALLSLIPAVMIIDTANVIFHKVIMGFIIVFWIYVGVYLVYYILKKAGIIVTGDRNDQ